MVLYPLQFLIVMTCLCAKLVSVARINHFIKSHRTYFCVFSCSLIEDRVLNSLKTMKKSPITNSDNSHNPLGSIHYNTPLECAIGAYPFVLQGLI